jgi:hypothetical protein
MLAKILHKLRKPSFTAAQVAAELFDFAVAKEVQNSVIDSAGLGSIEAVSLTRARAEIVFLNCCAIYGGMYRYEEVKKRHLSNLDDIYLDLLRRFQASTQPVEFLQTYEERLIGYCEILELWLLAHQNKPAHEHNFAIGETFFGFCGVRNYNPISLAAVQYHFFSTMTTVRDNLLKLKL